MFSKLFGGGDPVWRPILEKLPSDLVLVHELGLPEDPSSIYGRERLEVRIDGALSMHVSHWGKELAFGAQVDPKIVKRWAALLLKGHFPKFPDRPITPGASFRFFEASSGGAHARAALSRAELEEVKPYEELCAIADSLAAQVRGRPCHARPDPAKGAVHDVSEV
jgi:hypothetical protein